MTERKISFETQREIQRAADETTVERATETAEEGTGEGPASPQAEKEADLEYWRDRALRLQAEMENHRKRQRRLVEEQITADQAGLLTDLLQIVDDLERVLTAEQADAQSLREGIALIQRKVQQLLDRGEVEEIVPQGQAFDPAWHEAAGAVPHQQIGAAPNTVVEVLQKGYRRKGRLLRPARVIVAT